MPRPLTRTDTTLLWKLLALVAGLYAVYSAAVFFLVPDGSRGVFGDAYGGINALFSAFAFAGLIYTAALQRDELGLQREELEETRKELKGQRDALEKQNALFVSQGFESTFFHLIQLHHQIVDAIRLPARDASQAPTGRTAFARLYDDIRGRFSKVSKDDPQFEASADLLNLVYLESYTKHQQHFGHYFRNLYHIYKFIDEHPSIDQRRYASFARAQLSTDELACLFYNCLSQLGETKFKPLAVKYSLFKNLPWDKLLNQNHIHLVDKAALFGRVGD